MSPRTASPAPLDDNRMWRKILARLHDDAGGSHELFLFGQAVREAVGGTTTNASPPCSRCPRESRGTERGARYGGGEVREEGRVSFPEFVDFDELTWRALGLGDEVGGLHAAALRLLFDCRHDGSLAREQERGASYKQLAAIGHALHMDGAQRGRWYEIAEMVPLSQRHAGHILSKLKGRG